MRRKGFKATPGLLCLILLLAGSGCRTGGQRGSDPVQFSGQRVLSTAAELADRASTESGKRHHGQTAAFAWIEGQLQELGAEELLSKNSDASAELPPSAKPLIGVLPGRSPDVFLLAATCCAESPASPPGGRRASIDSVSGAAVVLELGRVLKHTEQPFTVWLAFFPDPVDSGQAAQQEQDVATRLTREPLRLAVFFESLAWPKLRVIRDLHSQGVYREAFWESARSLDLGAVFVQSAPFGSPAGSHRLLLEEDFRPVVALVGEPGFEEGSPSRGQRLDELGRVVLDALQRIATRLESIDEFSGKAPKSELLPKPSHRLD
ncbi:MAG: hypothetical protein P8M78_12955 [Myxococcota bacterium]|nr:hypothetical protein [Myxococcota bacterium]